MRAALLALAVLATPLSAQEVGRVGVDWVGNDIIVEALPDPEVEGVTCHVAYFERSLID
ncbi:MAG TPA: CreA family protein, partial [Rubellimicrobium sp.]|nr:CreA family protein [Rubellimicrobium sp.]